MFVIHLVVKQVVVPHPQHPHVVLHRHPDPDWLVGLLGRHGPGSGQVDGQGDLGPVSSAQSLDGDVDAVGRGPQGGGHLVLGVVHVLRGHLQVKAVLHRGDDTGLGLHVEMILRAHLEPALHHVVGSVEGPHHVTVLHGVASSHDVAGGLHGDLHYDSILMFNVLRSHTGGF